MVCNACRMHYGGGCIECQMSSQLISHFKKEERRKKKEERREVG